MAILLDSKMFKVKLKRWLIPILYEVCGLCPKTKNHYKKPK